MLEVMKHIILKAIFAMAITAGAASAEDFTFKNIEGGEIKLSDYRGGPVLVVNTASMCGYTYQYEGLQKVQDELGPKGLTVLAVPSDDFNQEYDSNAEVKDFCEVNYGLTVPMTEVTRVRDDDAHPFYQWLKAEHRFKPRWNFYKVLLDADGEFVAGYSSSDRPNRGKVRRDIEKLLTKS